MSLVEVWCHPCWLASRWLHWVCGTKRRMVHDTASMERKAADLEMLRLASHRWLAQYAAKSAAHGGMAPCRGMWLPSVRRCRVPLPKIHRQWTQDSQLRGLWQELALVNDGSVLIRRRQLLSLLLDCAGHDRSQAGFTLIELLCVVALLAVMASLLGQPSKRLDRCNWMPPPGVFASLAGPLRGETGADGLRYCVES